MSARRELAEDLQPHKILSPLPVAEDVLAIFVHAAVGHFAGQYMEEHDPVFSQLYSQALLAKRTEGDSAGDRFENMLTKILLTRIEHHPCIVILTSNNQSHIDSAFMRRLDVVIEFPSPNAHERYLIWRSHLGERAPSERLCHLLAAYCDLPGGFIRNAVLNAAACEGIQAKS